MAVSLTAARVDMAAATPRLALFFLFFPMELAQHSQYSCTVQTGVEAVQPSGGMGCKARAGEV
jgi:hypothetical protein